MSATGHNGGFFASEGETRKIDLRAVKDVASDEDVELSRMDPIKALGENEQALAPISTNSQAKSPDQRHGEDLSRKVTVSGNGHSSSHRPYTLELVASMSLGARECGQ